MNPKLHKRLALIKNLYLNNNKVNYLNTVDLQSFSTQKVDFNENFIGQINYRNMWDCEQPCVLENSQNVS